MRIEISIIIPVYNASLLLDRCLDSVFSQTTKYSYEVVIVDDGSTDDTVNLVKRRKEQDRIVFYQQQNAGPAVARNKGVELAHGEFCAYLDADDYWLDGYIEQTVTFLREHPDCVAVTVAQQYMKNGIEIKKNPVFMETGYDLSVLPIGKKIVNQQAFILDDFYSFWEQWNHVGTCSTTMRREQLLRCGGQRSDLRICEDLEFWPYLASYGEWGFIPHILYISDGWAVVNQQGWKKYVKRFKDVPMFDQWVKRLSERLTEKQMKTIESVLNGVIYGESRSMISGGDYRRAYDNFKYFFQGHAEPYPYKLWKCGKPVFYTYAILWRFYQYLKINRGVLLKKVGVK